MVVKAHEQSPKSVVAAEKQLNSSRSLWVQTRREEKKPPSSLPALQLMVFHNWNKVRIKHHVVHSEIFNNIQHNKKDETLWYCDATFSVPKFPQNKVFDLFFFCRPCWANDWLMIQLSYLSSQHAKRSPIIWAASIGASPWTCTNSLSFWEPWSALVRYNGIFE